MHVKLPTVPILVREPLHETIPVIAFVSMYALITPRPVSADPIVSAPEPISSQSRSVAAGKVLQCAHVAL